MPKIRVLSLEFDSKKFRKLKDISIPIAQRLTIIGGHNGIGKSTILALLAHPSGLTKKNRISYFDKTYQANFNEIIHIDYQKDFKDKLGPPKTLANPRINYEINGAEVIAKACRLGPRTPTEARMVARSVKPNTSKFTSLDGSVTVGPAGKVPLPTIYLGMTRVLPIGEAEAGSASSSLVTSPQEDRDLVSSFMNKVITGSNTQPSTLTVQKIKDTGKASGQPQHAFDPRCVSLGQDSLGSIALAIASFQKLKREWPDGYPGGLLIIDEIDAGLHPHAIGALVKALKHEASRLDLQIVATTHSPRLIKAVHPDSEPLNLHPLDGVVYIRDTGNPNIPQNLSLQKILDDMDLVPVVPMTPAPLPPPPVVKVYFEDDEAAYFFSALAGKDVINKLSKKHGVKIDPLPLGIGCASLARLPKHDPYFKTVIIVLDADAAVDHSKGRNKNIVKLPGDAYSQQVLGNENPDIINRPLSPERTLLQYILDIINRPADHQATLTRLGIKDVTTDQLTAHMVDGETTILSKREQTKKWWLGKADLIQGWGLVDEWVIDRPNEAQKFFADLDAAIAAVLPLHSSN